MNIHLRLIEIIQAFNRSDHLFVEGLIIEIGQDRPDKVRISKHAKANHIFSGEDSDEFAKATNRVVDSIRLWADGVIASEDLDLDRMYDDAAWAAVQMWLQDRTSQGRASGVAPGLTFDGRRLGWGCQNLTNTQNDKLTGSALGDTTTMTNLEWQSTLLTVASENGCPNPRWVIAQAQAAWERNNTQVEAEQARKARFVRVRDSILAAFTTAAMFIIGFWIGYGQLTDSRVAVAGVAAAAMGAVMWVSLRPDSDQA